MAVGLGAGARTPTAALEVPTGRHLVAVCVHAADLVAAAGGLLHRVAVSGASVDVLIAAEDPARPGEPRDRPGLPGVRWHRLALRQPIGAAATHDLLGAISELVGFDPAPGAFCLAPPAAGGDPDMDALGRAAERVAEAYRLPVISYLSADPGDRPVQVLPLSDEEWARKSAVLHRSGARADDQSPSSWEFYLD